MSFDGAFDFFQRSIPGSGSAGRIKPRTTGSRPPKGVFVTTETEVAVDERRISFEAIRFPKAVAAQMRSVDDKDPGAMEMEVWMDHPK